MEVAFPQRLGFTAVGEEPKQSRSIRLGGVTRMTINIDGVEYFDAFHFVRFKKPWVANGLVFFPLYTLQHKYLAVLSETTARELNCCARSLLRTDNIAAIRPAAE